MAGFRNSAPRSSVTVPKALVLAIGWKAYIHARGTGGRAGGSVPGTDGQGGVLEVDLSDGDEVEITAWQPQAREGVTYRVKRLRDGRECWVEAIYLRKTREADASPVH